MWNKLRRISLTKWILIGMVTGVFFGWLFPDFSANLKPLSTLFS